VLNTDTHNTPKLANTGRTNTPQYGIVKDFLPIVGNRWDDGRYLGCNTVHRSKYDHHSHNPTNLAPPQQCGAVLQLLVNDLGARFDGFWSHSMNIKFQTTPTVTTGQAAQIARECGGQPHQAGNDRLAAAINEAKEPTAFERAQADALERMTAAKRENPTAKIYECSGCSRPTLGAFGPSGMWWRTVCQSCKDKADGDLERATASIGKISKWTTDRIFARVQRDIAAAEDAIDPRNAGGAA